MGRNATFTVRPQGIAAPPARMRLLRAAVALSLLLTASPAFAATDIQGTPDDLRLDVQNATIDEILNALAARFKLTFTTHSHSLRALTGTYSGTLRKTLTRILDGNDYIMELSDRGFEIVILGASTAEQQNLAARQLATAPAATPTAPAPAPAPGHAPGQTTSHPTPPAASVARTRPLGVPNPNPSVSSASVPPLSRFAVVPPVTP